MTRFVLLASVFSALALAACGDAADTGGGAATDAAAPAAAPDAAASAAPADAGGPARAWVVDPAQSTLLVQGEYGGTGFEGTFNEWTADIMFSPDDLANSSIRADVQVASLRTGDGSRDEASASSRWLNADDFPSATYESTSIEASGDAYVAHGNITVAGVTSPLDLLFDVEIAGSVARATMSTDFNHHDLGITGGYDDVDTGDYFAVRADITANAQ